MPAETQITHRQSYDRFANRCEQAIRRLKLCTEDYMNNIVYIVGLIVIVIAILSFFGLR
jgi:hypothetical protein